MAAQNVKGWVCHDCGVRHGRWYRDGIYVGPSPRVATYHLDTCDCCGAKETPCTEPRDYGGLRDPIHSILGSTKSEPKSVADLVETVMDRFDFERVHTAMRFLDWKWAHPKDGLKVPNLSKIKETAQRLLNQVALAAMNAPEQEHVRATGGFWASADGTGLWLKFVLTDWDEWLDPEQSSKLDS